MPSEGPLAYDISFKPKQTIKNAMHVNIITLT